MFACFYIMLANLEKMLSSYYKLLCNEGEETAFHTLCECLKMAQTDYKKRHDKVA